ncbi:cleavage and polyadenylation specificity factor subunit 4 [Vigna unguiculata]|uniref:Cleavage and polyadenylation specificity factor subunit 4 n=1 Tax=Vigna unguiculata TaxID=3917 RepID=A0A4D6MFC1_VIGUN|nr:cleavage and polyadenylation specificity factor subunit 4 [Vigna unguiculata]
MHLCQMGMPGHQQGQPLVGVLGPQNNVGNPNYSNPMYPVQGQVILNAAQINLSHLQGQMLAQSILNILQPSNVNMSMPNGQFRAPYPMQNMNQQLPTQMSSPSQVVPHGMHPGSFPMFGFPNQLPQAMVNPYGNIKTNVPNTNWNGSPSKNFKNRPTRGGFKGGFQKSKFNDVNNGKRRTGFLKDHNGRGPYSGRAAQDSVRSKELKQQLERSFSVTYTEQEIKQWREARKKNHPCNNFQKEHLFDYIDDEHK